LHGSCASSISLSLCIVSRGWRVPAIPNCCAGFCVCPPKKHALSSAHTHRFEVTSVDSKSNRSVDFMSFLYQPLFVLSHGPRSEQFLLLTRSYAATGLSDLATRWGALVWKGSQLFCVRRHISARHGWALRLAVHDAEKRQHRADGCFRSFFFHVLFASVFVLSHFRHLSAFNTCMDFLFEAHRWWRGGLSGGTGGFEIGEQVVAFLSLLVSCRRD